MRKCLLSVVQTLETSGRASRSARIICNPCTVANRSLPNKSICSAREEWSRRHTKCNYFKDSSKSAWGRRDLNGKSCVVAIPVLFRSRQTPPRLAELHCPDKELQMSSAGSNEACLCEGEVVLALTQLCQAEKGHLFLVPFHLPWTRLMTDLPVLKIPVSKKGVTRVNIVGLTWSETAAPLSEVCQRLAQVHSAREAAGPPEAFAGWKGSQQGLLRPAADHLWIPTRNGAAGILGTQVYETWWLAMFWAGGLPAPIFLWASLRSS